MRPAPSFEIELSHFGLWRGGVAVVALLAAACLAAWLWQAPDAPPRWIGGVVGGASILAALASVWRIDPVRLRWDGQAWAADDATASTAPGAAAQFDVVIDLGNWMLLRLRPGGLCPGAARWIPAQRRGHEAHWHGMRRAVYFPRSTVAGPPGAEPHLPE